MDKIIVSLATHPARADFLPKTIESIKKSVVPVEINIWFNDASAVQYFDDVTSWQQTVDNGARSKLLRQHFEKQPHYMFTCDDDLIYHPHYFETLVQKLKSKKNKCVAGVHGSYYLRHPVQDYFWSQKVVHFQAEIKNDQFVTMLGTGTMAYHSTLFDDVDLFKYVGDDFKNMVDVKIAELCINRKIPRLCIQRPAHFVKEQADSQHSSIWHKVSKSAEKQTAILNAIDKRKFLFRPKI
mgnify:CR=1 FL=1